ncbi:hypothetical protein SAMN05421741_11061 [Paenimyroides ummariense]|uniref:Ig-like domain (Group 3) n=1 Tax=Paenimyroides ummariense TaxID=913024 RepID=A0A1I5BMV1_9FLAO|nr:hypothetical protein [Paenimyroides ummariense]SFN75980.1 hypothetical protein SAMN05421741_11061 [Paenimyroides ummariense]
MKINKLLFFLLAVFSLNSCVEYVDNGTIPTGPEIPEELKFVAVHSNPNEAKYIGDKFEFTAALNGVDVTKSTKFKVNGTTMPSNTYTPVKTGPHTVIATMDDYTSTFKFTVQEKEEEPEPTGNRIEYDGDWKPVTNTFWIATGDPTPNTGGFDGFNVTPHGATSPVVCTKWLIVSMDHANDPTKAKNLYYVDEVFIPVDMSTTPPSVKYPHQATNFYYTADSGMVFVFDNTNIQMTSNQFNFISGTTPSAGSTANYTATGNLVNSKEGKLFWNGAYSFQLVPDGPKAKGMSKISKIDFTKSLNTNITKINLKK